MLESPFPLSIWDGGVRENKEKPNLESHCRQSLLIIEHHEHFLFSYPILKLLKMCYKNSIFLKSHCRQSLLIIEHHEVVPCIFWSHPKTSENVVSYFWRVSVCYNWWQLRQSFELNVLVRITDHQTSWSCSIFWSHPRTSENVVSWKQHISKESMFATTDHNSGKALSWMSLSTINADNWTSCICFTFWSHPPTSKSFISWLFERKAMEAFCESSNIWYNWRQFCKYCQSQNSWLRIFK